jgi:hypothetical protein
MNRMQLDAWIVEMIAANREQRPLHDRLLQGATELADEVRRQWSQVADLRAKAKFQSPGDPQSWGSERRRIASKLNAIAVGVRLLAAANEQTGHQKDAAILRNLGESAQAAVPVDLREELDSDQLRAVTGVPRLDPEQTAVGVCLTSIAMNVVAVELKKDVDTAAALSKAIESIEHYSGQLADLIPEDLWNWGMAEAQKRIDEFKQSDDLMDRRQEGTKSADPLAEAEGTGDPL